MDPTKQARVVDIRRIYEGQKVIRIGDLHGCYDELMDLLQQCKYRIGYDLLIFNGDIGDRGPKIGECFLFAYHVPNVYVTKGNHDDKLERYLRGNPVSVSPAMQMTLDQLDTVNLLKDEDFHQWLIDMPEIIRCDVDGISVHAGLDASFPINKQSRNICMRVRNYNPANRNNLSKDENDKEWWHYWKEMGPHVYFGHAVTKNPFVHPKAWALDGGCVFGGELRAAVTENGQTYLLSQKARRTYYEYKEKAKETD